MNPPRLCETKGQVKLPSLLIVGASLVVAVFVVAAGLKFLGVGGGGYQATFVFPHATNLFSGSRVQVDGFNVGPAPWKPSTITYIRA